MEPVPVSRLPSLNALRCFEAAARSGSGTEICSGNAGTGSRSKTGNSGNSG